MTVEAQDLNVTIQTLKVDGKKMTIALFKQIPLDEQWDRSYSAFGYVHWDGRYFVIRLRDDVLHRCDLGNGNFASSERQKDFDHMLFNLDQLFIAV